MLIVSEEQFNLLRMALFFQSKTQESLDFFFVLDTKQK